MLLPLDPEQQHLTKLAVPLTQISTLTTTRESQGKTQTQGRQSIVTYIVRPGDVLSMIAQRFEITTQTLVWANDLVNPDNVKPEAELKIPPTSGVLHPVKAGDTLAGIAQKYQAEIADIVGFTPNNITDPNALVLNQLIMIPGAVKPVEAPATRLAGTTQSLNPPPAEPAPQAVSGAPLQWPTYGPIYGWFGGGHRGLDISPPYGTPVYAAEAGVVAWVQYVNYGYGYHFLVDHGNGYQTLYAHLSQIVVQSGERVVRGQHIGRVGSTGRVTGPHLHFEVHHNGIAVNPLGVLPR